MECKICGGTNVVSYWGNFVACQDCGIMFQPVGDALDKYYTSGTYRNQTTEKWMKKRGISHEEAVKLEVSLQEYRAAYLFEKFIPKREWKSHLDVGCSMGTLLRKMDAKIQVGVDPDPVFGSNSTYASIDLVPEDQKFELITIIQTLEHVADPKGLLLECEKRLADDGLLVIEVPNRVAYAVAFGREHPFAFDLHSLSYILGVVGLKPTKVIFHSATENTPLAISLYVECSKKEKQK